jgi:hypothetical protein
VNNPFGADEASQDRAAITARVVSDARRLFRDVADDALLERCVRQTVADLWSGSIRVTSFVPVLALREVREVLAGAAREPVSHPTGDAAPMVGAGGRT